MKRGSSDPAAGSMRALRMTPLLELHVERDRRPAVIDRHEVGQEAENREKARRKRRLESLPIGRIAPVQARPGAAAPRPAAASAAAAGTTPGTPGSKDDDFQIERF